MKLVKLLLFTSLLLLGLVGCSNTKDSVKGTVMLGNIANATVKIYEVDSNGLKKLLWSELSSDAKNLADIGKFNVHQSKLKANQLYLYEVSGGEDWDYNDDGIKDSSFTQNQGTFRSIIYGKDVTTLGDNFTVTYLSELLYQSVKDSIGSDDFKTKYQEESKKLLSSTELSGLNQTEIAEKINSYIPSKKNVELNASIETERKNIIDNIMNGNKTVISQKQFKSVSLLENRSVNVGSIVPIVVDINVSSSYGSLPVTFILVNEDNSSRRELVGYTLDQLSNSITSYQLETIIPADVNAGKYSIEVVVSGKDDTNSTQRTTLFNVNEKGNVDISGLTLDDTQANSSESSDNILAKKESVEMSYSEEGVLINSTLKIENRFADKNITNIKLSGYLDVSDTKIYVPLEAISFKNLDSDNDSADDNVTKAIEYNNVINIPLIESNTILNISTNILIDRENLLILIEKLGRSLLLDKEAVASSYIVLELKTQDGESIDSYKYPITFFMSDNLIEALTDNFAQLKSGTITVEELLSSLEKVKNAPAYKATAKGTEDGFSYANNKLSYKKSFSKSKYGDRVGAGIYAIGNASLDADGVRASTEAFVKLKVLKKKHYKIFEVDFKAGIEPASFEDTGYDFVVKSLGYNLYTRGKSLTDITGLTIPTIPNIDTIKDTKLKKAMIISKAKKVLDKTAKSTTVFYKRSKDFGKTISKKQTIIAGFIPVVVEVGAQATIGYTADIKLQGITQLKASFTPNARIGAWIDGGVGAGFDFFGLDVDYSAGVGGEFYLISDDFKNSITASLDLVDNETKEYVKYVEGNLHENITNYFYGPHGRFYLYGKWFGPEYKSQFWKPWKWGKHKRTKTLARWETTRSTTTLLDKRQNLFKIQLVPDLGIAYPDSIVIKADAPMKKKNILFAHGLYSSQATWETYSQYAEKAGWNVYRTNVDKVGSIATRAEELANYINGLNLEENSLIAVGHSMGGLDLRYIVSYANETGEEPFASASKIITKIYTIATPHGGSQFGGISDVSALKELGLTDLTSAPALKDLGLEQMAQFNKDYPYTTLKTEDRVVPLLAIRAVCDSPFAFGSDGVVSIARQSLDGAPYTLVPFIGKHTEAVSDLCAKTTKVETENTEILDDIFQNGTAKDGFVKRGFGGKDNQAIFVTSHRDIVFYKNTSCKGDTVGKFNSDYTIDIDCSESDECVNNEASSVMLYPNIKKSTAIRVYDHPDKKTSTRNYTTIYRGVEDWDKPVCITGFQHSTSPKESGYGISTSYHKVDSSKKLNSEVSHIKIWNTKD